MNFNLGELEELFKDILEIIDYVEGSKLKDRRTTLYLANKENITYCVTNASIAHLLGINTTYLVSTNLFNSKDSFGILKEMCENPYRIHKLRTDGHLTFENFMSEHIKEKIAYFKENIKINMYETEFICAYNKTKSYYTSSKNENCDYIMVKQYEDGKVGVIYIIRNGLLCVPMSNRIFNNMNEAQEELKELLVGQEITLLTGNTAYNVETDFKKTYYLPLNYKAEKINELKKYKNLFDCHIDVVGDYEYTLDRLASSRETYYETNNVVEEIVNSIINGKIIDRNLYLDSTLLSVIDACNDHICKSNSANIEGEKTYTSVIAELAEVRQTLLKLETENKALNEQVTDLSTSNEELIKTNAQYQERENAIIKILKPEN